MHSDKWTYKKVQDQNSRNNSSTLINKNQTQGQFQYVIIIVLILIFGLFYFRAIAGKQAIASESNEEQQAINPDERINKITPTPFKKQKAVDLGSNLNASLNSTKENSNETENPDISGELMLQYGQWKKISISQENIEQIISQKKNLNSFNRSHLSLKTVFLPVYKLKTIGTNLYAADIFLNDTQSVVACDSNLVIFDMISGKPIKKLIGREKLINSVFAFSNGRKIISTSEDFSLIHDSVSGNFEEKIESEEAFKSAILNQGENKVIVSTLNSTIQVFDLFSGKKDLESSTFSDFGMNYIASISNSSLFFASSANKIYFWDSKLNTLNKSLALPTEKIVMIKPFDRDSKLVATTTGGASAIIDLKTFTVSKYLFGHHGQVQSAMPSEDGTIITSATDGTINIYDPTTGELLETLIVSPNGNTTIFHAQPFAKGNKILSLSSDNSAIVWQKFRL